MSGPRALTLRVAHRLARALPLPRLRLALLHRLQFAATAPDPEPELRGLARLLPERRRRAVDAGANAGHYALELARYFPAVEAFEANSALTADLKHWGRGLRVHDRGLSDAEGRATLHVPVTAAGQALHGWGSLEPGNFAAAAAHREVDVRLVRLDDYGFDDVDFLKIDVEGHELAVLRGAARTIARSRPSVLVESKGDKLAAVRDWMAAAGYRECDTIAVLGAATPENHWFVAASLLVADDSA